MTGPPAPRIHDPLEGITPDGMIVTGAGASRIPPVYRPVLEAASRAVSGAGPDVSLYLYGSVATGTAVVPTSDVDLFTIGLGLDAASDLAGSLTSQFADLCRHVGVGAAQDSDYEGDAWAAHGNRVFLRHYCVHLEGPDPGAMLPDYQADVAAARGFNGDLAVYARGWRRDLADGVDPAILARRIGRKCLFAVAGMTSVHDGIWTTDRARAAARWSEIEPAMGDDLVMLLRWGDGEAAVNRDDVGAALDGIVRRIVQAFDESVGLW